MRILVAAGGALALLSGCFNREPNYRNYGVRPHEWTLPGPDLEEKVFGPLAYDEVRDFVREMESQGWEVTGYESASLPEDVMVDATELDVPSPAKRPSWSFDIPKTMDDGVDAPQKTTVPPYLRKGVMPHRQKYLVTLRRWL